jgi:hypothetical protein
MEDISIFRLFPLKAMMRFAAHEASPMSVTDDFKIVRIEEHQSGLVLVATDGCRVGVWHESDGQAPKNPIGLPCDKETMKALRVSKKVSQPDDHHFVTIETSKNILSTYKVGAHWKERIDKKETTWLEAAREIFATEAPHARVDFQPQDPFFTCSWQKWMPTTIVSSNATAPAVAIDLLSTFAAILPRAGIIHLATQDDRHLIVFPTHPQFAGIVMPVAIDNKTKRDVPETLRDVSTVIGKSCMLSADGPT